MKITAKEYCIEVINYGGILTSRHEVMKHMKSCGAKQKDIDMYFMGLEKQNLWK